MKSPDGKFRKQKDDRFPTSDESFTEDEAGRSGKVVDKNGRLKLYYSMNSFLPEGDLLYEQSG